MSLSRKNFRVYNIPQPHYSQNEGGWGCFLWAVALVALPVILLMLGG